MLSIIHMKSIEKKISNPYFQHILRIRTNNQSITATSAKLSFNTSIACNSISFFFLLFCKIVFYQLAKQHSFSLYLSIYLFLFRSVTLSIFLFMVTSHHIFIKVTFGGIHTQKLKLNSICRLLKSRMHMNCVKYT